LSNVEDHYRELLAPVYRWMAGDTAAAFAAGAADLSDVLADVPADGPGQGGLALDLGAGFGMHAIPLARAGYEVMAIDSSERLLEELRQLAAGLQVRTITADLMGFPGYLPGAACADLIVCMGDTLTHLPELACVERLAQDVAMSLRPGGRFVATFRDYTRLPAGTARFIPVRSDSEQILTCFLEDQGASVQVHDLLHRRQGDGWALKVSSYTKLKLDPREVCDTFTCAGLTARVTPGARGMVKLVASRA
jgi:SAM-dependent methyltransferase